MSLGLLARLAASAAFAASFDVALPRAALPTAQPLSAGAAAPITASGTAESGAERSALAPPAAPAAAEVTAASAERETSSAQTTFDGAAPSPLFADEPGDAGAAPHPVLLARRRSDLVLQRYFPRLYWDLDVQYHVDPSVARREASSLTTHAGAHMIFWSSPEPLDVREASPFGGRPLQSRVVDFVAHVHEYAHLLLNLAAGPSSSGHKGPITALSTITEGFALTVELTVLERMLAERAHWGLSDAEAADLREWRRQRLHHLRKQHRYVDLDYYAIGMFHFLRPLFKRGGEEAVELFLQQLNVSTLQQIPHGKTILTLIAHDPAVFRPVLSTPLKDQPALHGLRSLLTGEAITQEQRAAALALLDAADERALRRAARLYLRPPVNPDWTLSPMARLAAASPRAARVIAEQAAWRARSEGFATAAARYPEWAEALVALSRPAAR